MNFNCDLIKGSNRLIVKKQRHRYCIDTQKHHHYWSVVFESVECSIVSRLFINLELTAQLVVNGWYRRKLEFIENTVISQEMQLVVERCRHDQM
jgi:hypothetical protein